jgi:hypothetical protein
MSRGIKGLRWLGTLAGIVAVIGFGVTLVVVASFYALSFEALNVLNVGSVVFLVPPAVTAIGLVAWGISKLGVRYLGGGQSDSAPATPETSQDTTMGSEHHLREFNRANKYVAVAFGILLVVAIGSSSIRTAAAGTPLAIVAGVLVFGAEMLGGAVVHALNAAWFGIAWIGIREYNATEAWLMGVVGWALFAASGALLLSTSLGAIAIVIAGLSVLRVGYRARDATELTVLDERVSGTELERFIE